MRRNLLRTLSIYICLWACFGCATYSTQRVVPTSIDQAQTETPEAELLDVGIAILDTEMTEKRMSKDGTHPEIRKAERHFVAYHLKQTLQHSGHWGAVRVMPLEADGVDLMVQGDIVRSNGERLVLKVDVRDAAGNFWLRKTYKAKVASVSYSGTELGQKDAFQALYNSIANDIATFKAQLTPEEIRKLRTVSQLKFAADFVPDAFGDYLSRDEEGRITINRLPAAHDPFIDRLMRVREREHLFVDTLNEHYDEFYNEMWTAYEDWRKANLTEQSALRRVKRRAIIQQTAGALMTALAIGLGAGQVPNTGAAQLGLLLVGSQVIVNGINVSQQAAIHREALLELSESFGNDLKPAVMQVQGREYELSGSAEEQYKSWRQLLRKIYYTETGFDPPTSQMLDSPASTVPKQ